MLMYLAFVWLYTSLMCLAACCAQSACLRPFADLRKTTPLESWQNKTNRISQHVEIIKMKWRVMCKWNEVLRRRPGTQASQLDNDIGTICENITKVPHRSMSTFISHHVVFVSCVWAWGAGLGPNNTADQTLAGPLLPLCRSAPESQA